jgi:radical SAM superfamily enzyme YgiQ (UPF0313 family)
MKIALVRPRYKTHLITPPLGLGYLSSYLKSRGYEVKIIDALNLDLSNEGIVKLCRDYDLIGITCLTDFYLATVDLSRRLKAMGKIVVLGNVHPSFLPEESLRETQADYAVIGEGEITLAELVEAIEKKVTPINISGVYYLGQSNFTPREFIANLDSLPFPDWEQMDPRTYQKAPHGALIKNFPVAPIITTRGCPYACKFCASPGFWKQKLRFRSPENVINEIEYLVKNFGVKEIHFEDDNLTFDRRHVTRICELIIERGIKISWATPNGVRADKVDEELLRLMKRAGCYYIVFGVESGNQEILNSIHKAETLADIERAVNLAHKLGIMTQGFFILGLPGETEQTIRNSVGFAKKIPLDRAQFLIFDLLPGSSLWTEHKDEFKYDFHKESFHEPTWVPPTITAEKLKEWQPKAFREFFFRPGPIFSLIRFFRLSQLKFILKRLFDFKIFN